MPIVCLFCGNVLTAPEGAAFKSGDLIPCECGESSDFDSVVEVAKKKALAQVKDSVQNDLKKRFGKIFKKR